MAASKHYAFDVNTSKKILQHTSNNILIYGPPGGGKTSLYYWLLSELGQSTPWVTNCTPDMSAGLVTGHPQILEGAGYWAYGPALQAWQRGEIYLVDDLHKVSSDAEAELLTIGNDIRWATKTLPDGTEVKPKDGFRMIATMNGVPDDLDTALRDRFEKTILVRMPSDAMLDKLDEDVQEICRSAYEAIDAELGEMPKFSYRECRGFCTARKELEGAGLGLDKEGLQQLAAELALDGSPVRADGFMRLVKIAQTEDPDEEDERPLSGGFPAVGETLRGPGFGE